MGQRFPINSVSLAILLIKVIDTYKSVPVIPTHGPSERRRSVSAHEVTGRCSLDWTMKNRFSIGSKWSKF